MLPECVLFLNMLACIISCLVKDQSLQPRRPYSSWSLHRQLQTQLSSLQVSTVNTVALTQICHKAFILPSTAVEGLLYIQGIVQNTIMALHLAVLFFPFRETADKGLIRTQRMTNLLLQFSHHTRLVAHF
jgi:hypothetical protein